MSRILEPIEPRQVALWGQHTVRLRHTLAARELFSDDSIAGLIDTVDLAHMKIETMPGDGCDARALSSCDRGELTGHQVPDAVRRGRIWIELKALEEVDDRFAEVRCSYAMNYGNGLPRTVGRWRPRSRSTTGPAFWAKVATTAAWRASGMQRGQRYHWVPGHRIDLDAPNCVRPIVQPPAARTSG
ncbi:MAG TPA: hypothetical protein VGM60_14260 [Pseudonocardia sp.]|uniref:hypothetical protein n=1 Tax=Pseudonocardia sp. TaxID=60912 RepID=UPI002F3FCB44